MAENTGNLLKIDPAALEEGLRSGRLRLATQKESCLHILRALISYHERMTMGNYPERDIYLNALRYAISCVEEKSEK